MGRHATGKVPAQPLQIITTRHREMMYLIVRGMTGVEISNELGISQSRVSIIRHSPLFKAELAKLESLIASKTVEKRSDINARVAEVQVEAVDFLSDMLDPDTEVGKVAPLPLKRAAANDLLDLGELRRNKFRSGGGGGGAGGGSERGRGGNDELTMILQAAFDQASEDRRERKEKEEARQKRTTLESQNAVPVPADNIRVVSDSTTKVPSPSPDPNPDPNLNPDIDIDSIDETAVKDFIS